MTFCLAFATPDGALVAADTRLSGEVTEDVAELRFKNPLGGEALVATPTLRKIRPLGRGARSGWITSAGVWQFTALVFREIAAFDPGDLDGIGAAIRRVREQLEPALLDRYPDQADRVRHGLATATFLMVHGDSIAGCLRHAIDGQGQVLSVTGLVVAGFPLEFAGRDEASAALIRTYEERLMRAGTVGGTLRETAALFQSVATAAGQTGSVSELIEIGMLRREAGGIVREHLPPTLCHTVIASSDADLRERLATLP